MNRLGLLAILVVAMAPVTAAANEPRATATLQARPAGPFGLPGSLPRDWDENRGFIALFDGATLNGWDGDPAIWRVEDGAITAVREAGKARNNDYLVYRGIKARDFDLRLEIKIEAGGTGIQYRSQTGLPWTNGFVKGAPEPHLAWMMTGPQADLWGPVSQQAQIFTGQVYIENSPERVVAWRGEATRKDLDNRPRQIGAIGDVSALGSVVRSSDWNQYEIIARGGVIMHFINGQLMALQIDDDPKSSNNQAGLIGIEAELSPARIQVRNIRLRKLD